MSLLRRDRRGGDRYETQRNRRGPEAFFDDFAIDPPRRPIYHTRSSIDTRVVRHLPVREGFFDDTCDPRLRPRSGVRRAINSLPFGKAMRKLFKQSVKAEQFYSNFQSGFDEDIAAIRKYATPEILTELWLLKVSGGDGNRRQSIESQDTTLDNEISSDGSVELFETMRTKMVRSLNTATCAKLDGTPRPSRKNMSRLDSAARLQRKLDVANEQIQDLLQKASKGREYCDGLLNELELLKTLIDPENERNKELYSASGDEQDGADGDEEDEDG